MDDWRGRWCAILFFGYATLIVLDLPWLPAREWFNQFLDVTFGRFRMM